MKRYIAVDSGKGHTKVATYDVTSNTVTKATFPTRYDEGTFEDTDPGSSTFLVQMNGRTYKVGRNAANGAELTSSKKTFVHKLCTLFAIAKECSENEVDEVYAAIGIPVKDYQEVELRNKYRDFILPADEEITISYKLDGNGPVVTKTFKFAGRYVYPESLGAIFVDGVDPMETIGVIDIGWLNVNMTIFNDGEPSATFSVTTNKGANALTSGLAQKLTAAFSFINKDQISDLLNKRGDERCLKPRRQDKKVEAESKAAITRYITDYVTGIMDDCRTAQWSVDYTQFVFIGGTVNMIDDEIKEVFGSDIIIPEDSEFVNATGFLRAMCGRKDTLRIDIFENNEDDNDDDTNEWK